MLTLLSIGYFALLRSVQTVDIIGSHCSPQDNDSTCACAICFLIISDYHCHVLRMFPIVFVEWLFIEIHVLKNYASHYS